MNLSMLMLSFGLMSPAQTPERTPLLAARGYLADSTTDRAEMYRHIEVMRQLLRHKLALPTQYVPYRTLGQTGPSSNPLSAAADYFGANPSAQSTQNYARFDGSTAPVDGVYLPGYGVVFTVSLPAHVRPLRSAASKPDSKALSDWERAEREVKGEKPAPTAAAEPTPSVTDIIVDLLAMNGQRFTKLRDDERITVVVTVHETQNILSAFSAYPITGQSAATPYRGAVTTTDPLTATPGSATSPAKDYELLADMHLKQKQYDAAISAYAKAIAKVEDDTKDNRTDVAQHYLAALLMKQAQAQIGTGQTEPALSLLARIAKLQAGDGPAKPVAATGSAPKQRVPSKLIITAPKSLLDQVQKISGPDFRKGLQIEDLTLDGK